MWPQHPKNKTWPLYSMTGRTVRYASRGVQVETPHPQFTSSFKNQSKLEFTGKKIPLSWNSLSKHLCDLLASSLALTYSVSFVFFFLWITGGNYSGPVYPVIFPFYFKSKGLKNDFVRNILWTFEDIHMLVGSNMPIFGGGRYPAVSLRLR